MPVGAAALATISARVVVACGATAGRRASELARGRAGGRASKGGGRQNRHRQFLENCRCGFAETISGARGCAGRALAGSEARRPGSKSAQRPAASLAIGFARAAQLTGIGVALAGPLHVAPQSDQGYSRPETISFRRFKIWEKIFVRIWTYIAQDRRTRLRLTSERQLIKIFLSFLSPSCAIAQCVIVNRVVCINLKLAA